MEVTGKLSVKMDTQVVSDKFQKREFVLTVGDQYPQEVIFELTQTKVSLMDTPVLGSEVKVYFNLRGKKWEKDGKISYFNKLEAWKVEVLGASEPAKTTERAAEAQKAEEDLPF